MKSRGEAKTEAMNNTVAGWDLGAAGPGGSEQRAGGDGAPEHGKAAISVLWDRRARLQGGEQHAGASGALGHRRAALRKTLKSQSTIFSHIGVKLKITEGNVGNSQIPGNYTTHS